MVSLMDAAPAVEYVNVGGTKVSVYGVSSKGLALLFGRYPDLFNALRGDIQSVLASDAAAAIIAAGCGFPGDEKAEALAGTFSGDVQADLLAPILKLTMPKGAIPFIEKWSALGAILNPAAPPTKAPATKSSKRSTNSSEPVTTNVSSGTAPPVN